MGDDPRIRLLGFVPEERIGDFYASLDVFTLPSVNAFEAFGIVQAVAMLAAFPCCPATSRACASRSCRRASARWCRRATSRPSPAPCRTCTRTRRTATRGIARAQRAFSVANVLDAYEVLLDKAVSPRETVSTDRYGADYYRQNGQAGDRPALRWYARLVRRYCGPGPYLDFGCGTGHLLRRLAAHGSAAGLEVSAWSVAAARATAPGARVYDDPDALPDAGFGALVAVHVLEHLDDDAVAAALATWRRVLVPGGRALVATPDPAGRGHAISGARWIGFADPTHVNLRPHA